MGIITNKQFGVWMDSQHATIVGMKEEDGEKFEILEELKNTESTGNSNENTGNNAERGLQQKFFKSIAAVMPNVKDLHVSGTGTAQEQFIHFLSETPQFKNVSSTSSTSNKMSDEKLVTYMTEQF